VGTKSQLGWLNLPHLPILQLPVTAIERVLIIPANQDVTYFFIIKYVPSVIKS